MQAAIIGFSKAGKSTLFSVVTGRDVTAFRKEGEAIEAVAVVRDPRVDDIAGIVRPKRIRYAEMRVVLVPDVRHGSDSAEWVDPARRSDLLCVVVRGFNADDVYHEKGSVDPERDRRDMTAELLLADLELIEKRLDRIGREKKSGETPAQMMEEKTLVKCKGAVEAGRLLNDLDLTPQEQQAVRQLDLLSRVPVLWVYNVDEGRIAEAQTQWPSAFVVSGKIEREIMAIEDPQEREQYLRDIGLEMSGSDRLIRAAYDKLGMMSFYTMGPDEARAWTIRKNTAAPAAGGKIHSDIERGFIRVEVIKHADLMAAGSEAAARAQGKMQLRGRDYIIEDGDICLFRFNV